MGLDFPAIYLLPFHISADELYDLEVKIGSGSLTYDIRKAKVVLGRVSTKQRATLELRSRSLWTEEVGKEKGETGIDLSELGPSVKRRKIAQEKDEQDLIVLDSDSSTESDLDTERSETIPPSSTTRPSGSLARLSTSLNKPSQASDEKNAVIDWGDTVKVLKLAWFTDSLEQNAVLPFQKYLLYEGRSISKPDAPFPKSQTPGITNTVPSRAPSHATSASSSRNGSGYQRRRASHSSPSTQPTPLLRETTSEHDTPVDIPLLPSYMKTHYSCQRPTPLRSPNDSFISELEKIKTIRILKNDLVGIRAYSSSIASLAAYPFTVTSAKEILRLPRCSQKIAQLYQEWSTTGRIKEADLLESDNEVKILHLFYQIWSVGPSNADMFYKKGWRDLDDVVEYGWDTLSRTQKIGVKYYDEFLDKIPRSEVEEIGAEILRHANMLIEGFQMVITGGYRRGKALCGDVDVILSHPGEKETLGFVERLQGSLVEAGFITYTLILHTTNSERGQIPTSMKPVGQRRGGFDSLDKALVVWQDQSWPSQDEDLKKDPPGKNPNPHRRVDIIISPWETAGCAVLGWTGGTTFQRDLRQYCNERKLKFDSSGLRSRVDGSWVDFERGPGDMLVKEKRIFSGLDLEWRDPTERCTER